MQSLLGQKTKKKKTDGKKKMPLGGLENSKGLQPRPKGDGGTIKVGPKLAGTLSYSLAG